VKKTASEQPAAHRLRRHERLAQEASSAPAATDVHEDEDEDDEDDDEEGDDED
jgi:hypothetical protein